MAIVPKKLYTMKVDTQVDGVKMINGHLALFGPYYIGIVDNVKLKYMAPKARFHIFLNFYSFKNSEGILPHEQSCPDAGLSTGRKPLIEVLDQLENIISFINMKTNLSE